METFIYSSLPMRVRFGRGESQAVGEEVRRLGRKRAVVLSTPGKVEQAETIAALLGELSAGILPMAVMHTPIDVTEAAMARIEKLRADCTIGVGGGSTIGLGKAIALRSGIPQIALPTTYAGSEMTTIIGQSEGGRKTTQLDARVLPASVIYDVDYTLGLPVPLSVASGVNAMAHALEALYSREKNPVSRLLCLEAIRALVEALPAIARHPGDVPARERVQYGAFLCGLALGSAGMALHHKLCHTLGGTLGLPHAETHTVILPHAAGFNAAAAPELAPLKEILGSANIGGGLWDFIRRMGGPTSLAEIGMRAEDIDRVAEIAAANAYWNPRSVTRNDLRELVTQAYAGARPTG